MTCSVIIQAVEWLLRLAYAAVLILFIVGYVIGKPTNWQSKPWADFKGRGKEDAD